jgi:hypothetical protein
MQPTYDTESRDNNEFEIGEWQEGSPFERRTDRDCRQKMSAAYFKSDGLERRTGKERRQNTERRDRWLRIGKWRSELIFDE